MKKRISYLIFRLIRFCIWLIYPKTKVEGAENLPDEPCIVVGNHAKTNGPIACELYFPTEHDTWCNSEMMTLREVPDYTYRDFWSHKGAHVRWLYRILSYLIAPLSVCIFNNASCIPVYHDLRIVRTFRETVQRLRDGVNIVIFPEHDAPHNRIVCDFQDHFVDVARSYYKKTGKEILFVPLYVAPRLHALYFGKGVRFNAAAPLEQERRRICESMMDGITELATGLPEHTVVPYRNIPKKQYPTNKEPQNETHETACR